MLNKNFFTKPRWLVTIILLITLCIGNTWAAVSLTYEWTVSAGKGSLPSGVTHSGLGTNYGDNQAPYYLKYDTQGDYIQIQTDATATQVKFRVKMIGGNSTSKFKVQGSANGSTFTDIQEFTCSGATNDVKTFVTTNSISSTYRYFKIIMSQKGSNVGFGYLKINGICSAIDVTDGNPVILPAGSTSYTSGDWKKKGAPDAYPDVAEAVNIGSSSYCTTMYYAADNGGTPANGLHFKASTGYIEISDIVSTNGIDVDFVCSGTNGFKVELTGASDKAAQTGTVTISTTSTTATLKITKNTANEGYVTYIRITPKTASCSATPTIGNASINSSVSLTGATVSCAGITKGDCDIDEWGFYYKTGSSGVTTSDTKVQISAAKSTSNVSGFSKVYTTELTPGTHYYFKPYAKVGSDVFLGSETDFTTKTLSATRNNSSYGGVPTVSGNVITASPNSGYIYGSPTYEITSGNGTIDVVKVGDTFTVTSSTTTANVSIQINYAPKGCTDHAGTTVQSGSAGAYSYGPVDDNYAYSVRQILYTKTDLDLGATKKGAIKSLYFKYDHSSAMTKKTDVKIYMANTYLTSLSTSSFVPYASFTQVYSGSLNGTSSGWFEVILDSPFEYNGAGNLAVMIDDNSGDYDGDTYDFIYHESTGDQIYSRSDYTHPDPTADATWKAANESDYRPSTKFCIEEKDMVQYTVNWYVNGTIERTQTGYEGTTLTSIPTPTKSDCDGSKYFMGWYTSTYSHASSAPTYVTPTKIGGSNADYYAVFATRGGAGGAAVNTVVWSEDFSGFGDTDVPSGDITNSHTGTTVYGGATVTYACVNGGSDTKLHGGNETLYAGGTKPELLVGKNTGTYTISGIPNGGASELTVSYKQNDKSLTASVSGTGYSGSLTANTKTTQSFDVTVGSVSTFTLTFAATTTDNARLDDIVVKVKTQGYSYSDFTTNCCTPLGAVASVTLTKTAYTITATWPMTSGGNETGYSVQLYDNSGGSKGDAIGEPVAISGTGSANRTHTFGAKTPAGSRLTANHKYYVGVTPTYSGAGDYCPTGTEAVANTTTDQTYTVTYNANGGTVTTLPSGGTYEAGDEVTVANKPTTTTKSGCTFTGWNTANDGSGQHYDANGSTTFDMPSSNVTLYAEWTAKKNYFVDRMHGNWDGEHTEPTTGYNCYLREGAGYTVPDLSDDDTGSNSCVTGHAHFVGWVASGKIGAQGQLLSGYTVIKGGTVQTAGTDGTIYYAVWAEE